MGGFSQQLEGQTRSAEFFTEKNNNNPMPLSEMLSGSVYFRVGEETLLPCAEMQPSVTLSVTRGA